MTRPIDALRSAREIELGPRGAVEIALPANTIRLRGIDGTRATIRVPADREIDEELVIDELPGRVRVREVDRAYRLGPIRVWSRQPARVEIDLPRDASIELQTVSGDVDAAGIAGDSRWATASGDLRLELGDGSVTAESMSGDINLVASDPIAVAIRAVSGDVRIWARRIGDLAVSTTSGAVGVEAALGEGAAHRLSSVSGTVELLTPSPVRVETASITGDLRASGVEQQQGGRSARTLVAGDGSVPVAVRTTSGDIRLRIGALPERTDETPVPEPGSRSVEEVASANATDQRDAARMEVLRALERGEMDVDAATRELETIETGVRNDG